MRPPPRRSPPDMAAAIAAATSAAATNVASMRDPERRTTKHPHGFRRRLVRLPPPPWQRATAGKASNDPRGTGGLYYKIWMSPMHAGYAWPNPHARAMPLRPPVLPAAAAIRSSMIGCRPDGCGALAPRGKSGHRRAGCWVTPRRGNPTEERNRETDRRCGQRPQARVKRCGKSAPAVPATAPARQAPPGATPDRDDDAARRVPGRRHERLGNGSPRWMAVRDRIRLTGLLRNKPWRQGLFYSGADRVPLSRLRHRQTPS